MKTRQATVTLGAGITQTYAAESRRETTTDTAEELADIRLIVNSEDAFPLIEALLKRLREQPNGGTLTFSIKGLVAISNVDTWRRGIQ